MCEEKSMVSMCSNILLFECPKLSSKWIKKKKKNRCSLKWKLSPKIRQKISVHDGQNTQTNKKKSNKN